MWLVNEARRANEVGVPGVFKNNAVRELTARWEWMTFDIHRIAYALAPDYHHENVFAMGPVMLSVREVVRFFADSAKDAIEALREFTEFKNNNDVLLFPPGEHGKTNTGMPPKAF